MLRQPNLRLQPTATALETRAWWIRSSPAEGRRCSIANDAYAKKTAGAVLEDFGWEAADMGSATAARAIEPLRCIPGFLSNRWMHAFKVLWE